MTRQTRTLLLMALLAVAGVIALGVMADRYGKVLTERRAVAEPGAPPVPTPVEGAGGPSSVAERLEAERLVDAWLRARLAMRDSDPRAEPRIVAGVGLTAENFRSLEAVYQAWREGRGDGRALFAAFESRRPELDALDAPARGDR